MPAGALLLVELQGAMLAMETLPTFETKDWIEVWKAYLTTAENTIERRLKVNQHFYSVTAAVVTAYAYLAVGLKDGIDPSRTYWSQALCGLALMITAIAWRTQLAGLKRVAMGKFATMNELERFLIARPLGMEASVIASRPRRISGTSFEMLIPILVFLVSLAAIILPTYLGLSALKVC